MQNKKIPKYKIFQIFIWIYAINKGQTKSIFKKCKPYSHSIIGLDLADVTIFKVSAIDESIPSLLLLTVLLPSIK